jgi:hypothetical protein
MNNDGVTIAKGSSGILAENKKTEKLFFVLFFYFLFVGASAIKDSLNRT